MNNKPNVMSGEKAVKRYVWLDTISGKFSNSWDEESHKKYEVEKLICESKEGWKMIEYTCVNDKDFEFNNYMKLK